jgi:hypothetical protein
MSRDQVWTCWEIWGSYFVAAWIELSLLEIVLAAACIVAAIAAIVINAIGLAAYLAG